MTVPRKYQKKPVTIEAIEFTGHNANVVRRFMGRPEGDTSEKWITINTLEGTMFAYPSDYIIKGVNGEFYPCRSDVFYKTYEDAKEK